MIAIRERLATGLSRKGSMTDNKAKRLRWQMKAASMSNESNCVGHRSRLHFFRIFFCKNIIKWQRRRYINKSKNITYNKTPMKQYSTSDEMRPSRKTINMIKQIAYTYRAIKMNGRYEAFCLN